MNPYAYKNHSDSNQYQAFHTGDAFVKDGIKYTITAVYHDGKDYLYEICAKLKTANEVLAEYTKLTKIE